MEKKVLMLLHQTPHVKKNHDHLVISLLLDPKFYFVILSCLSIASLLLSSAVVFQVSIFCVVVLHLLCSCNPSLSFSCCHSFSFFRLSFSRMVLPLTSLSTQFLCPVCPLFADCFHPLIAPFLLLLL